MPDVSSDGLTWTFHLKTGLHYAPPMQNVEIVAGDVVRALEREARVGSGYSFYFDVIEGFDEYGAHTADSISGLQTPDDHTLVVTLTTLVGDLGSRLALPGAAPIPPGAADGHADYGRFLVASGPYMFEGSQDLDFSEPPADQTPVSGYVPWRSTTKSYTAGSVTLVRNPSWDPATDALRAAYVDRIEVSLGGYDVKDPSTFQASDFTAGAEREFRKVIDGRLDLVLDTAPPARQLRAIRSQPLLASRLHVNEYAESIYITMNLAVPPFDDIHVREAMNLALDKATLRRRWLAWVAGKDIPESTGGGDIASHIAPNEMEGNLLLSWHPGWMDTSTGGDLVAARAEMARSKYDRDSDGICDAAVCRNVQLAETAVWPRPFDGVVRHDLSKIGIQVRIHRYSVDPASPDYIYASHGPLIPAARTPLMANGWFRDYPGGSAFFPELMDSANLGSVHPVAFNDFSMLGASAGKLRQWRYPVRTVPGIDDRIRACSAVAGVAQQACWAQLDQFLMERVVPWVPFLFQSVTIFTSSRVARYSFDQATGVPALDQIALTPAAIASS